ncbi:hypothetical protein O181_097051 [Austropuccinia psidii MF-1]|uniref:Uncharacterized protein n=1 Tax=Austropuccinia psidii MF-1 TaxID=1389203 RepID=A0A9Q3J890_9BASI|nr:hypothetical protein [Austropuccinia psidii MF-1]
MIKQFFRITEVNNGNNISMMTHLQSKFNGMNITWDCEQNLQHCTCHTLNLMAKYFLLYMCQLENKEFNFFDNYLSTNKVTIEDSDNEATPSVQDFQGVGLNQLYQFVSHVPKFVLYSSARIKLIKNSLGEGPRKARTQSLNKANLEMQDKSSDLEIIRGEEIDNQGDCGTNELGTVICLPGGKFPSAFHY